MRRIFISGTLWQKNVENRDRVYLEVCYVTWVFLGCDGVLREEVKFTII